MHTTTYNLTTYNIHIKLFFFDVSEIKFQDNIIIIITTNVCV